MKRYTFFIAVAISISLTCSCSNNEKQNRKHSTKDVTSKQKSGQYSKAPAIQQAIYYFDDTVVLVGKLGKEKFYGPPGYGDNPTTDVKEIEPVLYLDKKIKVQNRDSSESDDADLKLDQTKKMQVILGLGADLKEADKFYGKRVAIRGQLMEWETGHHHTPVLIVAQQLSSPSINK